MHARTVGRLIALIAPSLFSDVHEKSDIRLCVLQWKCVSSDHIAESGMCNLQSATSEWPVWVSEVKRMRLSSQEVVFPVRVRVARDESVVRNCSLRSSKLDSGCPLAPWSSAGVTTPGAALRLDVAVLAFVVVFVLVFVFFSMPASSKLQTSCTMNWRPAPGLVRKEDTLPHMISGRTHEDTFFLNYATWRCGHAGRPGGFVGGVAQIR